MLKTSQIQLAKTLPLSVDMTGDFEFGSGGDNNETVKILPPYTKSIIGAIVYLASNVKMPFTQLKKAFTKALIFCYFNSECLIRIEIDTSSYAIGSVLS